MRKLLYGAAAVVCFGTAGPAMANGMKDAPIVEPVPTWSGCYIGLNVGAGDFGEHHADDLKRFKAEEYDDDNSYDFDGDKHDKKEIHKVYDEYKDKPDYWEKVDHFSFNDEDDDIGPFGGGHLGCNWERAGFVFGIEGDIGTGDGGLDVVTSIRGRVGAAYGRSLLYLTAGWAYAEFDRDLRLRSKHYFYDDSDDYFRVNKHFNGDDEERDGFVLGAGWEYLLDRNFSFGVEGLWYSFDDDDEKHKFVHTFDYDGDKIHNLYKFDEERDDEFFVVRARLSYHIRRQPEPLK